MAPQFINKACFITGAAFGMGFATAKTLLALGARVTLCDISGANLDMVIASLDSDQRSRALAQMVDVTDRNAVRDSLSGRLDGVANFVREQEDAEEGFKPKIE
ncbi:hypothetical protein V1524DRAFT_412147 [Lipomyces starkeyi]